MTYLIYLYENRTVKPVEIVLRSRRGWARENDGGGGCDKVHCKDIWKCHSETPYIA
jgi:hypothetical protein